MKKELALTAPDSGHISLTLDTETFSELMATLDSVGNNQPVPDEARAVMLGIARTCEIIMMEKVFGS